MATLVGKITAVDIASLWDLLAEGVGIGLIDFSAVTEFSDTRAIESAVKRARAIPPCRLAFVCRNDVAFGSVRVLTSLCDLNADYNVFRNRGTAEAWLNQSGTPLLAA